MARDLYVEFRESKVYVSAIPLRARPTTPEMSDVVAGILGALGYQIDETPLDRIWKRVASAYRESYERAYERSFIGAGTRIPVLAPGEHVKVQPAWDDRSIARYRKD